MVRPYRIPVMKSFSVVPHSVSVYNPSTALFSDFQHPSIDVSGYSNDKGVRHLSLESHGRPHLFDKLDIGSDTTTRDYDCLAAKLEISCHISRRRDSSIFL